MKQSPSQADEISFDYFSVLLYLADVTTDALIAYQFFQSEHYIFFGLVVFLLILSNLGSLFPFSATFSTTLPRTRVIAGYVLVLFTASLLPVILCLSFHENGMVERLLRGMAWKKPRHLLFPEPRTLETVMSKNYLKHGGFLITTKLRSVPQIAIQLTFLCLYPSQVTPLLILSLLLSVLSVASKFIFFSNSYTVSLFLFTFLCYCTDLFHFLTLVSWLFWVPSHSALVNVPFLSFAVHIYGAIWLWCLVILGGVSMVATVAILKSFGPTTPTLSWWQFGAMWTSPLLTCGGLVFFEGRCGWSVWVVGVGFLWNRM
eukprot:TRINITY_DN4594_c0_g3_i1.p1 TRINITY_DN4594_c0_g3~~TRINITY_DN4594_c0_g3_i1.p1  ORF type:complete len:316 (+),score=32.74 TRINITY_DN4594_c0_g3_i1:60-1007(+)